MVMVSTAGKAGEFAWPSAPVGEVWRRFAARQAARREEARMRRLDARLLDDIGGGKVVDSITGSAVKPDGVLLSGFAR